MSAEIIHMTFDWSARLALGRRRLILEPGVSESLDAESVICVTGVRGEVRPSAHIDIYHAIRPAAFIGLAIGEITVVGGYGLYLRAVQTCNGFPTAFVIDVSSLDYSPAWSEAKP